MQRVYFDSHVYDLLVDPGNESTRQQLLLAVRTSQYEVYGSFGILEELAAVAAKDAAAYRKLVDCFWNCVRAHVLLDRALLLRAEWRKSNRLAMREACFPKGVVSSKIKPASYEKQRMSSVAREVLGRKRHDAEAMNRRFEEVESKIAEVVETARRRNGRLTEGEYQKWLKTVSEREVQDWLDTHRTHHRASRVSWQRAPCNCALIAWIIARAKINLLRGKKYERSARHDMDHFIYAAQAGTLVTNDQGLAKTVAFIQVPLVNVQTADEFFDSLLNPDGA